jgi:hypothetical protein
MVFGLSLDEQNPIEGITFKVGEFTGRLKKTADDFRRDILDSQKLIEDPFLLPTEFDNLQANRYRELSRVYDMVMFLKDGLKMSNGEIMMHFKGRGGFGTRTVAMILNGKFNPANLPAIDITSLLPKKLRTINKTDKWINNPLKLSDIYDRKALFNIKNKWMAVPLGLNNAQLEEYFITGEDPRLKETAKEFKLIPDKEIGQPPKGDEKEPAWKRAIQILPGDQSNVPVETSEVSEEVVKTAALPSNVNPNTGLTHVEEALLSNEEKAMRLRQKGLTA